MVKHSQGYAPAQVSLSEASMDYASDVSIFIIISVLTPKFNLVTHNVGSMKLALALNRANNNFIDITL